MDADTRRLKVAVKCFTAKNRRVRRGTQRKQKCSAHSASSAVRNSHESIWLAATLPPWRAAVAGYSAERLGGGRAEVSPPCPNPCSAHEHPHPVRSVMAGQQGECNRGSAGGRREERMKEEGLDFSFQLWSFRLIYID